MDTTKTITHIGICAGYGGIEPGLKRVLPALRTVAYSEIEGFACANLVSKMEAGCLDPAPIWTDVKTFPWHQFRDRVDVLTGGYPCQPFSSAGQRKGKDDPRHLWPYIAEGIRILKPAVCLFENVEGHITLGLSTVISDLEEMGYKAAWGIFSAAECGAPHQRKRVFIMAHRNDTGLEGYRRHVTEYDSQGRQGADGHAWPSRPASGMDNSYAMAAGGVADDCGAEDMWPSRPGKLVNAEHLGHNAAEIDGGHPAGADPRRAQESEVHRQSSGGCSPIWPSRPGQPQHAWEPPRVVANARCGERVGGQIIEGAVCAGEGELGKAGEIVGNAESGQDHGRESRDLGIASRQGQCGNDAADSAGEELAHSCEQHGERRSSRVGWRSGSTLDAAGGYAEEQRQTQPSMGRDTDGPACGLDYAELSVSCDNRTDELRLLGNGVVPATAALAFQTLLNGLRTC